MRWISKHPQIRIVRRFLFLPTEINGVTRWLEFATAKQLYVSFFIGWSTYEWID